MANEFQDAGRLLMGLSAGLEGKGSEFLAGIARQKLAAQQQDLLNRKQDRVDKEDARLEKERQKAQELERQKTIFTDSKRALDLAREGRFDLVTQMGMQRKQILDQMGVDSSDTSTLTALAQLAQQGDPGAASNLVKTLENNVRIGEGLGFIEKVKPVRQIIDGQVVSVDPVTGAATAEKIGGFRNLADEKLAMDRRRLNLMASGQAGDALDRGLRARQIAVAEAAEIRQSTKLSAGLEKALLTSQDRVVEAQRNANEFDVLANDFERLNLEGGLASTVSESLKGMLGTQDDVTEFRRKFNKVRLSEGLKNLPPGPATDKDVQEAFKGVPRENANAKQVASFLRGAARLARFEAGFNQFKADFISGKSTGKGVNQAWRKKVEAPALGRPVTIAEIYETAQNRGTTPEEIAQQLGIDGDLY